MVKKFTRVYESTIFCIKIKLHSAQFNTFFFFGSVEDLSQNTPPPYVHHCLDHHNKHMFFLTHGPHTSFKKAPFDIEICV